MRSETRRSSVRKKQIWNDVGWGAFLALPGGMTKLTLKRRSFAFKEAPTLSTMSDPTSSVFSCNA